MGYARDAKVSEDNAMASEVAAEGSAELAKQWATKLGAPVDGVDYSAKHYANKANEILTQGATDAVNRVAQEGDRQISLVTSTGTTQVSRVTTEGTKQINLATAQANEATRQANLATAKATEAEADATSASRSATEADASAKNSANSASTATQQATLATQKATEAKTNADKAALSKDAAKVSETNAKKSEANAKVSETNAKESELKAKQYADQATAGQIQADWKQTDSTKNDFIKNKPTLGTLSAKNSLAYSELTGVPTSFTPSSHTHPISQVTNLQASLDAKTNDATLQVDLTKIRQSITEVSSKVDGIGDTLSPTYAKKQTILDACDQAMNGANPAHAGDPALDDIKLALATIQAQLGQLESRRYVKETGKSSDGTKWYRKWSDGWIEQGGVHTFSDTTKQTVTFMKSFSNTDYIALFMAGSRSGSGADISIYLTARDTSHVGVNPDRSGDLNWYACGY